MKNEVLLSICIPTYNRCEYLKDALENIVSDSAFSERVEIIISDNASTDDTQALCEKYAGMYGSVFYYRNATNMRDQNYFLALQRATGKYVRLFNDTLRLNSGGLSKMLAIINTTSEDKALFFFQNIPFLHSEITLEVKHTQDFISNTSYYVTWIANFGNWKKKIDMISNPDACSELLLSQVDWSLQIVSKANSSIICYNNYFNSLSPNKKGGYNIFQVFVSNYLLILKRYIPNSYSYQKEKYRLFRYFVLHWYTLLILRRSNNYCFDIENAGIILMRNYWYYPYFYLGMTLSYLKEIYRCKRLSSKND